MNVFTWNMQGSNASTEAKWNTGVAQLGHYADVVCLQECGAVPASATPHGVTPTGVQLYTWGGTVTRPSYWIAWYPSDPNGNRCNLAVVTQQQPSEADILWPVPPGPQWRPVLGTKLGVGANARIVFTIHAISPNGPDAAYLLQAVDAAAGPGWVVAGDFNRYPNLSGYNCNRPDRPSHNANSASPTSYLDWSATDDEYHGQGVTAGLQLSDHYPVYYGDI